MPNYESSVKKNLHSQIGELENLFNSTFTTAEKNQPTIAFIAHFINILKNLETVSNEQYENLGDDNLNIQKLLKPAEYKKLSDAYKDAMSGCLRYMARIPESIVPNQNVKALQEKAEPITKLVCEISNTIAPDMKALDLYDPNKGPVSFQQLIAQTSPLELNIGKDNLGTVGAQLSARIPFNYTMPDGREVNGVFTPKSFNDPVTKYNNAVDRANEKCNGFKDFMDTYYKAVETIMEVQPNEDKSLNTKVLRILCAQCSVVTKEENGPLTMKTTEQFAETLENISNRLKTSKHDELAEKLMNEYKSIDAESLEEFNAALNDFMKSTYNIYANMNVNAKAGIEPGSRIDSRNSAMSKVCEMLKVPNLLAKSTPMTINYQGQTLEGTFMEKAKGMDYNHPTQDALEYDEKTFQTNGLKSIADLQVVDLICGNIDRHMANMLYQFDTTGDPKNHKFIGIQGIDNDASFGEILANYDNNGKFPGLNRLNVISESMAKTIYNLEVHEFKFKLRGFGLSEKQLNAAELRLNALKEKILDGQKFYNNKNNLKELEKSGKMVEYGYLRTIKDDEFKNLKLDKIPQNSFIFTKIPNFHESMQKKVADGKDLETKKLNTQTAYKLKESEVETFNKYLNDMQEVTGRRGTSPEFEKLRTAVGKYNEFCKEYKDGILPPLQFDRRIEHLKAIRNASVEYMKHKGLVDENNKTVPGAFKKQTSYAKKRIELVGKIAGECVKELEGPDKDFYRNAIKNRAAELGNKDTTPERKEFLESERKMFSDFDKQADDIINSKKIAEDDAKVEFKLPMV